MWTLLQDLRYALRMFFKSPGFALVAVITVALGIGANTAIFSVVESVLLKPLPYPEAERLVSVWESRVDKGWPRTAFSEANFWDIRDLNRSFETIGALRESALNLTGFEFPERLTAGFVSAGFFQALGARPVVGRLFLPGEDEPGKDRRLALLSHRLWTSRFGADRTLVGRSLTLDGKSYTVVGVLPAGHRWLETADVFVPLMRRTDAVRDSFELAVVGRLRPGVSADGARADLETVCRRLAELYPAIDKGMGVSIGASANWGASETMRRAIWILMGAVGLLLSVACVNLASLLLANSTARTRELALRAALGAGRVRVLRQTLTESVLLTSAGAVVGLGLASVLIGVLRAVGPGDIPRLDEVGIDRWVLAFTIGVALLTGALAGLVPALKTPRADLMAALREGERGAAGHRRTNRLRSVLVAAEVAMSLALLVGAGLLARSFSQVVGTERGFETGRRLAVEISLPASYNLVAATGAPPAKSDPAQQSRGAQFVVDFVSRIQAMPQVVSAAAVSSRPLSDWDTGMGIAAATGAPAQDGAVPWASWRMITRDYFRTMGLPLLKGRTFTEQDKQGRPWRIVVSKRLAELLWPGQDPIGQQAECWKGQDGVKAEVIGVVGNMRERGLDADPTLAVYLPYYGSGRSPMHFVVHTTGSPQTLVPMLRSTLASMDPDLPMFNVQSLEDVVSSSVGSRRFTMLLLVAFASVALLLALSGIYGVLAYAVARRTSEIGVRVALGGSPHSVVRLIIVQGMRPVVFGVGVGLAGSFALSRFMTGLLFGVTPADAPTYVGVVVVLVLAAACSCYLSARQALRIDVVSALTKDQ